MDIMKLEVTKKEKASLARSPFKFAYLAISKSIYTTWKIYCQLQTKVSKYIMAINGQEFRESRPSREKWTYEHFKDFLLAQARGEEFLPSINQYPTEIQIDLTWHQVLNTMREGTREDEIERVAMVGYNLDKRGIYLPSGNAKG